MFDSLVHRIRVQPIRAAALAVALGGAATILGAWFFQFGLGIKPCPLCLQQRIPYYVAIPLAALIAIAAGRAPRAALLAGLAALVATMLTTATIAGYHAGIEWKWWAGPQDCAGPLDNFGSAGGLLNQLRDISLVRCDEVTWSFLGLSLAGYNVLISLALAAVAAWGIAMGRRGGDGRVA